MATFYNVMLYGGLALAVIFAIAAVILFIKLKIPKVIGDLTGSTAKKQIQEIREKGYESVQGAGVSKKDAIKSSSDTGKISARDIKSSTQKVSEAGRAKYEQAINALGKEKAAEDYLKSIHEDATDVLSNLYDEDSTDILSEGYGEESTDILTSDDEFTDVLISDDDATNVLSSDDMEKNTLNENLNIPEIKRKKSSSVKKIMDIIVVHTEESI